MSDTEHEGSFSFRSLAELPRQTDPANAHIRPEVFLQWTFVAEIVAVTASDHYHATLVVRDGDEQVLTIGFDLHDNDNNRLDELFRTTFKTGCILLILDAHKVQIHGGRNVTGIVVNDIGHIKVLPFSLAGVTGIYSKLLDSSSVENGHRICNGCSRRRRGLHPCPLCRMAFFCNRKCQVTSANARAHARDCRIVRDPDLADLLHERVLMRFRSVKLIHV
ncbi:hypothetical protein BJX66DRAFT_335860 [Aspergillus keveii]|uniref:MYND-type domain-containing protein n=1 Tax=Aspergillus keveii TaxID=714993 RepID=A0ABR4GC54_9EURO